MLSPRAGAAEFEIGAGYLSASVREIVEGYGWSLVWAADEDRVIDHPFTVNNGSLRDALAEVLAIYRGQLVADLYEGNRVVLVDAAPPRIRVVLPGEEPANAPVGGLTAVDTASAVAKVLAEAEKARTPPATEQAAFADLPDSALPPDSPIGSAERLGGAKTTE